MYNNNFLFVNKIVFVFFSFENIIRIRNGKAKFGKCKDRKKCESQKIKGWKCMGWTDMEKFGNGYNLEIGLGFCR